MIPEITPGTAPSIRRKEPLSLLRLPRLKSLTLILGAGVIGVVAAGFALSGAPAASADDQSSCAATDTATDTATAAVENANSDCDPGNSAAAHDCSLDVNNTQSAADATTPDNHGTCVSEAAEALRQEHTDHGRPAGTSNAATGSATQTGQGQSHGQGHGH
jgi:hypothetical protein